MRSRLLLLFSFLVFHLPLIGNVATDVSIMPLPAEITLAQGRLALDASFTVSFTGANDSRLRDAVVRLQNALVVRSGIIFPETGILTLASVGGTPVSAKLIIDAKEPASAIPALGDDESYALTITPTQATLRAPTTTGALRGLQTLIQLVQQDAAGYFLPAASITDAPRFPWRGLMIDVCRRWHSLDEIKRIIDGMELVKLNVLHLHLTDDQGFRIESKTHPELHTLGSDGNFFTQDEMRDIIAYAAARAIQVVPEFDLPGHATSWGVSHPELLSGAPGVTYKIEERWGVFDPTMDPTNPAVYELLSDFLGEMSALFPDPFMHIGGDENNGKQWKANERIQKFITDNNLKDNSGLHSYFSNRLSKILSRNNKTLLGWDEILHPNLPESAVVHSWRGAKGVAESTAAGHRVILSHGYYIDLSETAASHYVVDPVPADTTLTPAQQKLVLGGEATMWSEWTPSEIIDSRLWPRTAAIAERFWSPQSVRDIPDMYRRLAIVSLRLDEAGMQHERNRTSLLRRLAGDTFSPSSPELAALRVFSDACEPVKQYARGRLQPKGRFNPQGGFADATVSDSASAREFNANVAAYLEARKTDPAKAGKLAIVLTEQLTAWNAAAETVCTRIVGKAPRMKEAANFATGVEYATGQAQGALLMLEKGPFDKLSSADTKAMLDHKLGAIDKAVTPNAAAVDFPATKGIKQLIETSVTLQATNPNSAP